jgi:hypothetical protein
MSRLKRSAAVLVAIGGLGLVGSAFQGLVQVDGTLQAATRDAHNAREQQQPQRHQTIEVRLRQRPVCPMPETQRL